MRRLKVSLLRLALPVLWLIGIVYAFELANRLALNLQAQEFRNWNSIGSPPGGASSIIAAGLNDLSVQSTNGQTYVYRIDCIHTANCHAWFLLSDLSNIEFVEKPGGVRITDCAVAGSPRTRVPPPGPTIDCFRGTYSNSDQPADIYYAITADGVAYFVWTGVLLFEELVWTALIGLIGSIVWVVVISIAHSKVRNKFLVADVGG